MNIISTMKSLYRIQYCMADVLPFAILYDTRCYFNAHSKADISQLNLLHGSLVCHSYRISTILVLYFYQLKLMILLKLLVMQTDVQYNTEMFCFVLQDIAYRQTRAFPLNSCRTRISNRCVLTSRPRGLVNPWHLSRIMWRLLADYNQLSGVQRAKW